MLLNPCFASHGRVNLAEVFTQPVDYFAFDDEPKKVHVFGSATQVTPDVSTVIVGGSGICTDYTVGMNTWRELLALADQVPATVPLVIWGMGINDHFRLDRVYDRALDMLQARPNVLIGLRDFYADRYVPCVSCMRPEFDTPATVQHEVGWYVHHHFALEAGAPMMSNRTDGDPVESFRRVLDFMASCETVVTNSYHGAYWATLLGRKVVVVAPFSNKFFGLKFAPVIVQDVSAVPSAIGQARAYPEALDDSRARNRAFYADVLALRAALAAGVAAV